MTNATPPQADELRPLIWKTMYPLVKDYDTSMDVLNKLEKAILQWHRRTVNASYQQGYDDCLKEHGAVFKAHPDKTKKQCPVCGKSIALRMYARHLIRMHGWRYVDNVPQPPDEAEQALARLQGESE